MHSKNDDLLLDRSQDDFRYLQRLFSELRVESLEKSRQAALETKRGLNQHYLNIFQDKNKK
jgi:hypothetical protein